MQTTCACPCPCGVPCCWCSFPISKAETPPITPPVGRMLLQCTSLLLDQVEHLISIPVPTKIRFDRASWPQPLWRIKLSFQPDRFGDAMFSEEQANSHKQTAIQTQTTIQHPHVNDARPSFDVIQLFEIESTTIEKHLLFRTCSVPNKS